jgi:hypothetical protein
MVERKFTTDIEHTYVELKNCLNMKEFLKHEKTKNLKEWRKNA